MRSSKTSKSLAWILTGVAALVNAAGYVWPLYSRFWWFDKAIHAFTLLALTLLVTAYLFNRVLTGVQEYRVLLFLTILCIGLAIGAVWEIGE
jgi:hypothetical protein